MPHRPRPPSRGGPLPVAGDESKLLQRLRSGDATAFAELVRAHRDAIRDVVRRYAQSEDDVDELVQQTFVRAHAAVNGFRGASELRTWLHRIAVNLGNDHARARQRVQGRSIQELDLITNSLGTTRMALREARRKLATAIDDLPPKQRRVVELRLFHDLPFGVIGEIVDCSEDSAKMNFQHAVKRLKAALEDGP